MGASDCRLIFSVSPGRSGWGYLAKLQGASGDVDAGQERLPALTDRWLRRVSTHGLAESLADRRVKAVGIRAELLGACTRDGLRRYIRHVHQDDVGCDSRRVFP